MLIAEMERQKRYYEKNYNDPERLKAAKITCYERDFRINVNKKLLQLLYEAKGNIGTDKPTFREILNRLR